MEKHGRVTQVTLSRPYALRQEWQRSKHGIAEGRPGVFPA
jgi:hypothetical protein